MVFAGVDCHKDTHTIVFLNELGKVEQELSIAATARGYVMAIEAGRRYGEVCWGLEGSGHVRYVRGNTVEPALVPNARWSADLWRRNL